MPPPLKQPKPPIDPNAPVVARERTAEEARRTQQKAIDQLSPRSPTAPTAPIPQAPSVGQPGRTNPMEPNVPPLQNNPKVLDQAQRQSGSSTSPPYRIGKNDKSSPMYAGMNQDPRGQTVDLRAVASQQGGSSMGYNPQQQQQSQQQAPINDSYQQSPQGQQQMGDLPSGRFDPAQGGEYLGMRSQDQFPEQAQFEADQARGAYDAGFGRFGAADKRDRAAGIGQGHTQGVYEQNVKELKKSAAQLAADPRFTPEQREQAFERLRQRAGELEDGFAAGRDLTEVKTGIEAPPETFGAAQNTGLQSMANGMLRNPKTGDMMQTTVAPNGQTVPIVTKQNEINSLPVGTNYMDGEGKMQTAGVKGRGGSSGGGGSGSNGNIDAAAAAAAPTQESVIKAYRKWEANFEPFSTAAEWKALDLISEINPAASSDRDAMKLLSEDLKANPENFEEILSQYPGVADAVRDARAQEFKKFQETSDAQDRRVSDAMGVTPIEKKTNLDPDKFTIEISNTGNARAMRRGGTLEGGIPLIRGADGEFTAAPVAMQQLMELETNTNFVNVQKTNDGRETRALPFSEENINLGDFAFTDAERNQMGKALSNIDQRSRVEWLKFEKKLRGSGLNAAGGFNDPPWDPNNLTPTQKYLEKTVHNFYKELPPEGKAAMTIYIAHSLGHKVDPSGSYTSTGWANKGNAEAVDAIDKELSGK